MAHGLPLFRLLDPIARLIFHKPKGHAMIDIVNEKMLPISKIPSWCKEHTGNRVHPSTVHRWRIRGARGVKLETVLIGGRRYTSEEALLRFFDMSTAAEDGTGSPQHNAHQQKRAIEEAEAYLRSEGI